MTARPSQGLRSQTIYYADRDTDDDSQMENNERKSFYDVQSRSVMAGMFIFMSGGMKIIEGLFIYNVRYPKISPTLHDLSAWFIAVILGGLVGAFSVPLTTKRSIYLVSSLLVIAGGIVCSVSNNHIAQIGAAYLDGIAFGVTMVATIIAGGEVADNNIRGKVVTSESLGISTGMLIYTMFQSVYGTVFSAPARFTLMQVQGLLSLIFGVIAFGTSFLAVDSSIHFIKRYDDKNALYSLQVLHNEDKPSTRTLDTLYEMKQLVQEDKSRSWTENFTQGLIPFFKISILRTFMTLSYTFPIVYAFVLGETIGYKISYGLIFFGLSRWIATLFTNAFLVEKLGRKPTLMISMVTAGALLIALGSLYHGENNLRKSNLMIAGASVSIALQFFCGLGQGISTVYMAEAFSTSLKPLFIFLIMFLENIAVVIAYGSLQMKPIGYESVVYPTFYYALGGGFLSLFFIVWVLLPETKNLSLRKAHHKFLHFFNYSFW
ncbi:hypothetical protein ACFFRR_010397 [Megaselia abdita]